MEVNNQDGHDYELSDFQISQHTIDPTPIPDCSTIAAAVVDALQKKVEYSSARFQYGVIGNYHPPAEFVDFDRNNLSAFEPTNRLDQSPPPHADWSVHLNWRRRALRQLYAEHNICSIQYIVLLKCIYRIVRKAKTLQERAALAKQEEVALLESFLIVAEEAEAAEAAAVRRIVAPLLPILLPVNARQPREREELEETLSHTTLRPPMPLESHLNMNGSARLHHCLQLGWEQI